MKLSLIFTVLFTFQVSASVYSQTELFNVNLKNTSVKEVFKTIENQSKFRFFYNDELIDLNRQVDLNVSNTNIEAILTELFGHSKITYQVLENNLIVILPKQGTKQQALTGIITDATNGEPVIGAIITIEGTTTGAVTDVDGKFSITLPKPESIVVISFLGYISERIPMNGQTTLNIKLIPDITNLSEVVVVGYGVQKKVNVTGAVTAVSGDNLNQKTVTQLSAALQGMAPGVTITQASGQPGKDAGVINIRGIGTLNSNAPLVLVDGVEYNINNINANDIESVSILKDAASSSIYGVRAANGVILITTKRGNKGKTNVSYSGYVGVQDPTRLPDYLGAKDFMKMVNLTRKNSGAGALYSDADIAAYDNSGRDLDKYADVSWINEIMKGSGTQQEHNLAITGGSDKTKYRLSTNYFNQQGLIRKTNFDRFSLRLNTDIEVNKHLFVSADLSGKFSTTKEPQGGMWMQFGQSMVTNPLIPVKYTNGDWSVGRSDGNVVRLQYEGGNNKIENNVITGNIKVDLKIIDGLTLTGISNGSYTTDFTSTYVQQLIYNIPTGGTIAKDQTSLKNETTKNYATNLQGLLNYSKTIDVHSFTILAGLSRISNTTNYLSGYRNNGSLTDLPQLDAGDPASQTNSGNLSEFDLMSYFGRINYVFNEKYLLEANIRRDGSSRFSSTNRWGVFPSFSAGWRISKESFMKDISWLKEMKIRGSWGQLGNQEVLNSDGTVNNYAYQSLVELGSNYPFGGTLSSGGRLKTYPNTEISWETTQMTDFGLDASILDGKIDMSFDYYIKKTSDILLDLPIPETVGLNAPIQNGGAVQNKGWEFNVGYKNHIGKDFNYGVRFNLSDVKNEITNMQNADYLNSTNDNIITAYYAGHPIGAYYGYVSEGILRSDEQVTGHATQFGNPATKGDIGYIDLNGDKKIDSKDRTFIGNPIPRFTGGLTLNATYKGFDFVTFFQGVGKIDINTLQFNKAPTNTDGNFKAFQMDNWREDNVNAEFPRLVTSSQNYVSSSFWIKSGSYLRLKNFQLGYTIPSALIQKTGITRCRFYIAGQNLVTWSGLNKYGIDPENPTDNRYYPQVKTYTCGVNVEF